MLRCLRPFDADTAADTPHDVMIITPPLSAIADCLSRFRHCHASRDFMLLRAIRYAAADTRYFSLLLPLRHFCRYAADDC